MAALSRVPVILLGCGKFKQTFVLDPPSGVDIMRRQEKTVSVITQLQRKRYTDDAPHPIRKSNC
jgi:hypothetical protein